MKRAWIGLGGNVGDVRAALRDALAALDETSGIDVAATSALYRTPPWGPVEQPPFLNCCAELRTGLEPPELLARMHAIEAALGRERTVRWGPRTVDLDLLFFEGFASNEPGLVVPHPRAGERAFVLVPLAEIAPDLVLDGRTIAERAAAIDRTGLVRLDEGPR